MDFFEALRQRALKELRADGTFLHGAGFGAGVTETIEALKEMMVGEVIPMRLEHEDMGPKTSTFLVDMNDELHARWDGYKGTDDEEVVVMVFRLQKP